MKHILSQLFYIKNNLIFIFIGLSCISFFILTNFTGHLISENILSVSAPPIDDKAHSSQLSYEKQFVGADPIVFPATKESEKIEQNTLFLQENKKDLSNLHLTNFNESNWKAFIPKAGVYGLAVILVLMTLVFSFVKVPGNLKVLFPNIEH